MAHTELGWKMLTRWWRACRNIGVIENHPGWRPHAHMISRRTPLEGRRMPKMRQTAAASAEGDRLRPAQPRSGWKRQPARGQEPEAETPPGSPRYLRGGPAPPEETGSVPLTTGSQSCHGKSGAKTASAEEDSKQRRGIRRGRKLYRPAAGRAPREPSPTGGASRRSGGRAAVIIRVTRPAVRWGSRTPPSCAELKKAGIALDRKILAELAVSDPTAFASWPRRLAPSAPERAATRGSGSPERSLAEVAGARSTSTVEQCASAMRGAPASSPSAPLARGHRPRRAKVGERHTGQGRVEPRSRRVSRALNAEEHRPHPRGDRPDLTLPGAVRRRARSIRSPGDRGDHRGLRGARVLRSRRARGRVGLLQLAALNFPTNHPGA